MRIALAVETNSGYFRDVLQGIAKYANGKADWQVDSHVPTPHGLRWLAAKNPAGLIVGATERELIAAAIAIGMPTVSVGHTFPSIGVPSVSNDHFAIGKMAADYLLGRGFRSFGYAAREGTCLDEREAGFCAALSAHGLPCSVFVETFAEPEQWVAEANASAQRLGEWLQALPKHVAILCNNDQRALALAEQCRQLGLAVPQELALLGVDNDAVVCSVCTPPLRSIQTASERIGYDAAHLLDQLLGPTAPAPLHIRVPPVRVVERRSTDALSSDDELIARVIAYMQENLGSEESVAELGKRFGCSRRSFERRFFAATGTGPGQAWAQRRLARAQALLVETTWGMERVAEASGFSDTSQLAAAFRKHDLPTPTQFRRNARPNGAA